MIEVKVNADAAQSTLRQLARNLDDRRAVNKVLAAKLTELVFRNFQTESHDGERWDVTAPLAPSTLRARERARGKKLTMFKILQDTGAMRESFLPFSDNQVAGVGALSAKTHAELSKIHEEGLGNVPARPMLPGRGLALKEAVVIYGAFVARAAHR